MVLNLESSFIVTNEFYNSRIQHTVSPLYLGVYNNRLWALKKQFYFVSYRELKDNMAGDAIEGEIPDLLKAILAKDPSVFRGGSTTNNTDHSGKCEIVV